MGKNASLWFLSAKPDCEMNKDRCANGVAGTDIEDRKQAEEAIKHENVVMRLKKSTRRQFEEIIGTSPPLQAVFLGVEGRSY